MWWIIYLAIGFVCAIRFARLLADNDDAFGSDGLARAGAAFVGLCGGFFWPLIILVGVVYYYAFRKPEAT